MGRTSRHKLERRLGQAQSTPKQVERATLKAQRRARNVPPTVEAYERVAESGPTRLIETLIGRHSIRIDNLDAVAQLSIDHCLKHLMAVCHLDAIFIRQGHQLNQHSPPYESPWPTHLSWSFESTIAALRLMLAGQIVGAAIILRQQLGRWTLLLARADSVVRRRGEPIESFIARAWTQRAMDMLGLYAFDVALDDIFDDLDDHPRTTGAIGTDHEHVQVDGRPLCPAHVYHTLCELIDAQHADRRVECEVMHDFNAEPSPTDTHAPAETILDTLTLCMIQMRLATVTTYVFRTDTDTMRGIPLVSPPPERRPVQHPSEIQLPLSKPAATRPPPALVPLVDGEFATFGAVADLWPLYTEYHAALADRFTAQRWTPLQLAELTFAAHRFSRLLVTADARAQDRKISGQHLEIQQHLSSASPYILTAEFAAVCALWNQSRPQIAAAATQISATLLSGYWLWIEEDDRAMGILRCTLHHAARLRTWHVHPDTAQALQSTSSTTPRRWLSVAGWSKFRSLDRALFEFAHANRESRLDAAEILDDHLDDPESPVSQRIARQTALDTVTVLAAAETLRVVAAQQSSAIANTMREALHQCGLDVPTNPARRQPNKRTSPSRTAHDTIATPDVPLLD
ncbi:hypothetical protein [Mycobacterium avium]|jgi:hypothetical protein|uniref:Uncharacterized protein n=1 Tax=Mycobacterium avium subsp. hominissuis TaxID=439334 RepID=A0A088DKE4_MYCAV|nr:hypothetical protein [Mycobacterium avium]AIL92413.1 hypothetical protein [Mycobacterium avium subsp. hominissuis]KBR64862.1 hypothetical protein X425_01498 [Mycobacterium avium XTB13-223]MDO2351628.1 hypothetical protein [Mycobacterium avium subsp. hominissuis]